MSILEIHDKPFNYLLQVENEYNKVVKKFDTKNKDYFDALRELRDNYTKDYDAIDAKSNQIIYGNPESKLDRKYRDRSDLYIKVVQRSQKYKNWRNFFIAIGAAAVFIILVRAIVWPFNFGSRFIGNGFENFLHIVTITAAWSGLLFDSIIFFKSLKYWSTQPLNTRAERKWLKKYFRNIRDIIIAKGYLEVLIQREEAIEKYINLGDTYIATLDAKTEIISKMKKDIEKVMDDFMHDGEVCTALDHVLESWKIYQ